MCQLLLTSQVSRGATTRGHTIYVFVKAIVLSDERTKYLDLQSFRHQHFEQFHCKTCETQRPAEQYVVSHYLVPLQSQVGASRRGAVVTIGM